MKVKMAFQSDELVEGEAAAMSAHDAAGVALATFCFYAAVDTAHAARAANLDGVAALYLDAWWRAIEPRLLSAMAEQGVPGAGALMKARVPATSQQPAAPVRIMEVVRDRQGRIERSITRELPAEGTDVAGSVPKVARCDF